MSSSPAPSDLDECAAATTDATTLRTLYKAEAAILAAYGWMPYPSDMEVDGEKRNLYAALDAVDKGLREVRKLKDELEKAILEEATR